MTHNGKRKHEWLFADYFRNTSPRFPEINLFRTEHGDCLSFQAAVDECRAHDVYEILDSERANAFFFEADETEDGEGVKRVTQVVEHVIATPVDDSGFENRVVESGVAHDLFCLPLLLV